MKKAIITIVVILGIGVIIFLFPFEKTSTSQTIISKIQNKLSMSCNSDQDCEAYLSLNTCEVICAAKNGTNKKIIDNYKSTCDPTLWDRYFVDCRCVENNCKAVQIQ